MKRPFGWNMFISSFDFYAFCVSNDIGYTYVDFSLKLTVVFLC